jgi:hypothetical protein
MNKLIKTNNVDYVIASDTDSIYVKMGSMVEGLKDMNLTEIEIVQAIDTFCEKKMTHSSIRHMKSWLNM